MIVQFLPQAKAELMDAVDYYDGELNGLGQRFWDEVDRHIAWIADNPEIPQLRDGGYRRVNLRVFPYYIAYIVRDPRTTSWRSTSHQSARSGKLIDLSSLCGVLPRSWGSRCSTRNNGPLSQI
jgi:hypothetical protein